jgi:hypothetical protein
MNSPDFDSAVWRFPLCGEGRSYPFFLEVHALCLIVAKCADATLQLSTTAALVLRPDSVESYLDEPHRSVCSVFYSALWP